MKKYKFITIKQVGVEVFEAHPVYRVFNNKSNAQIGMIYFYKDWKQYVFTSKDSCVFNNECLSNIIQFINTISAVNRKVLAKKPKPKK